MTGVWILFTFLEGREVFFEGVLDWENDFFLVGMATLSIENKTKYTYNPFNP